MKDYEKILVKHKDFIKGVALLGLNPSKGNDRLEEVLSAYSKIDTTVVDLSECATCNEIYKNSFKIILAYCEDKKWFIKK